METAEQRAEILLRATYNILKKCEDSPYVLNVLAVTDTWDGVECDGYCLIEDIEIWFDEFGKPLNNTGYKHEQTD